MSCIIIIIITTFVESQHRLPIKLVQEKKKKISMGNSNTFD